MFAAIALVKYRRALAAVEEQIGGIPVSLPLLTGHALCLALFGLLSSRLYAPGNAQPYSSLIALCWLGTGLGAIALGALGFVPWRCWATLAAVTGNSCLYALLADLCSLLVTDLSRSLWPVATHATFTIVGALLGLLGPVVSDPAHMSIGTPRFSVEIAPGCSGLEGVGLMLVFGIAWLLVFRRECRFPQALALLPAGVVFNFLLNSVRIAALILIGDAGAERIATGGFHSQAGWMIFNLAAIGFSVTAGRARWVTAGPRETAPANVVAVWVLPLVALLAAGMVSHALTGDFEWSYPLRFFAVAAVAWYFRRSYSRFAWRIGWQAPAMGLLVYAIWLGLDHMVPAAADLMPAPLRDASPAARQGWIAARVLAASFTVPLAEELAFRGYLLRRLIAPAFELVHFPLLPLPWFGLLVSSVAFGLMHGERWFAGILAGLCYALIYLRKGRIGESIAAHGVTNALLAANVLAFQHWHLW